MSNTSYNQLFTYSNYEVQFIENMWTASKMLSDLMSSKTK